LSFFVQQYVEESALCDSYFNNLVVFNDPDDEEYEDDDENESYYYLGEDLSLNYWIFQSVADGDVGTYLKLFYETSRVDIVKMLAYKATRNKQHKNKEKRKNGKRY